jgi:DNA-binding NarL/FixJ family response regulator
MKKIRLMLADDHTIVREGLLKMLQLETDFEVVGDVQNGRQAVELAKKTLPDVILMDVAMPLLNGLEAARKIIKAMPKTKVLILSAHRDDAYVTHAEEAGASGFLLKQSSSSEVCQAIRQVAKGGKYFSAEVSKRMGRLSALPLGSKGINTQKLVKLTSREREVLQLIAEGKANKQTASVLGISIKTVEKHREHLMDKLDIHDTAGLTRYAISVGMIESSVQLTIA